jgi:predicted acylesterase/phospholipase RssA
MFGDGDVDTLAKATMTSASFPIAFEPMSWRIQREINSTLQEFRHKFLDGGITNNSPVDVAAYAGATHLISLELSPLLSDIVLTDNRGYNVFNIYTGLFDTAAYNHLVRNISILASENKDRPNRNKMQIYRLAPLLPREDANGNKISPTTLDFDGVYDSTSTLRRSIYDWFMQGYLDAKGPSALSSLVFKDYTDASLDRGYMKNADLSFKNKFWRASIQAYPDTPPP